MKTMQVLPKVKVLRDPKTRRILSTTEPTTVPRNSYWMRRVICGDVEEVTTKPKPKKPSKSKKED